MRSWHIYLYPQSAVAVLLIIWSIACGIPHPEWVLHLLGAVPAPTDSSAIPLLRITRG
ncbi:hypothetical protein [Streptomyces hesseae]|uniref:Uncharacterized protein n=1 Tax=Streptomyces hesseae TaxID=3075519 RepID=A0ABU2SYD8_9ACTN|nr:hypothetical protein [Streptomyces sp. DSM 40473]MDT0454016.1 hypothetical protein [Streptomyces sp. DSM 40473]